MGNIVSSLRVLRRTPSAKKIKFVEIETTSICNMSCEYCPNYTAEQTGKLRPKKNMEISLYHKIVDQLGELKFSRRFSPHFYGEPLVDKRLVELVAYARQKLQRAQIHIYTNGTLLSQEKFIKLKEVGVDKFYISQHTKEPSKVIEETLNFIKKAFPEFYNENVEYSHVINNNNFFLLNRGGLIEVEPARRPGDMEKSCKMANGLTIDVDGNVILCCNDYYSEYVFGNLNKKSMKEIWNDPDYLRIRAKIKAGIWPLEICRKCTYSD